MPLAVLFQAPGSALPDVRLIFLISLAAVVGVAVFATVLIALLLRRRYQRNLQLQKMAVMGSTSARILHQVKNPVQSLLLQAELLEEFEREDLPELRREASGAIVAEAHRLARMLSELSTWTSGSRRSLALVPVEMGELLAGIVAQEAREAARRGVGVELVVQAEGVRAAVDAYHFRQAVENLMRNAREAMGEQPDARIRVEVDRARNAALVRVADNGPGIAPDVLREIWEPFVTTKGGGMGLGLPICRELVEAHGGEVAVESEVGVGTVFTITLPAYRGEIPEFTINGRGER